MDPARITELLMKHRTDLYAYILAAVCNHHDAEELIQEVSLAAVRSCASYTPGTNFRAWVREIARRRILERVRKSKRLVTVDPDVLMALEEAARELEDGGVPLDARRDVLRRCLERLQGAARRVIELRYMERMEVAGIARRVRRSTQACYALLKRARRALRECIDAGLRAGGERAVTNG
jgi:RNA polymerase sigma-70 factor (ECF subfamily)